MPIIFAVRYCPRRRRRFIWPLLFYSHIRVVKLAHRDTTNAGLETGRQNCEVKTLNASKQSRYRIPSVQTKGSKWKIARLFRGQPKYVHASPVRDR